MKWGIIPPWQTILFNIRDDSMLKKSWTKPYHQNRCIVIASAFYEFMKAGKERIPYRFGVEKEDFYNGPKKLDSKKVKNKVLTSHAKTI
jgi:putative SOS response-associated peptidase YedK